MSYGAEVNPSSRGLRLKLSIGLIILSTAVVIGLALAVAWYQINLGPASDIDKPTTFTIEAGQGPIDIGRNLESAQLIRSSKAFELYVTIHGLRRRLQSGVYALKPNEGVKNIANIIASGGVLEKRLTIPEGVTLDQIVGLAEKQGISKDDFQGALRSSYAHSFLATKPSTVDLEGYLFPDTYTLTPNLPASGLVKLMLDTFGSRVKPELETAFKARGLTLHQGITLASIIEREVSRPEDRPIVAQVIYSRLKAGQPLQIDATVIYAAKLRRTNSGAIAEAIKTFESPYNTYKHTGLPPGPICSPGIPAITAAASPATTDYLFYLADKNGVTHFARTAVEHEKNIQKYLR